MANGKHQHLSTLVRTLPKGQTRHYANLRLYDGAKAVRLNLVLRNAGGLPVVNGAATIELQPGGHVARFIDQLFPNADTADFQGTITATAEGGTIAATAIQLGSQAGQFTTLPVTEMQ